jgi:alpha-beta hydrolase superfamily lysophospholipase
MEKIPVSCEIKGVTHSVGDFDPRKLFYQSWSKGSPKAVLILAHGLGDHSGHMMTVVEQFVSKMDVFGYDLPGHGNSPGDRGLIQSWDDYRNTMKFFVQYVQEKVQIFSLILSVPITSDFHL